MARMIITGFPNPPDGLQWCAMCVAFTKGRLFRDEGVQQKTHEGLADQDREVFAISPPKGARVILQLEIAVTWGPHPNFGQAIVPLCWTHAPAIDGEAQPAAPQKLLRGLS